MSAVSPLRVAAAAAAAFAASSAWYAAFGARLARLDDAYAGPGLSPAVVAPVELVRSGVVATAVSLLAGGLPARGPRQVLALGAGLWAAFPVVLLTGSVVHEKVPWQQAAIHGGDWLVKLLLVSAVVGRDPRA
ncbi:hypothetical protein JOD57_003370 [Geodermatophilus bullaregiensis]|uniref:DUF1761 domain-containing protein n=1 Tax=Geodermatophilus bullaregiensis TaxID=1564160 RepID=UPI00195AAF0C|nr:DUF1761 domain-containing protein [Geodermatophilus bullaregiensis]MBM7807533.1 hypothetical protein [Geodermatophilus bullaregiensis]